ncbi:MAG: hypothetical protein R3B54_10020 [Bdellovibrionota bacterium]
MKKPEGHNPVPAALRPQQEKAPQQPGISVSLTLFAKGGMEHKLEKKCTLYVFNFTKLASGKCRYDAGIAAHCLKDWNAQGVQHDVSVVSSDRIGSMEEVQTRVMPGYKSKADVATSQDTGYLSFVSACSQDDRRIPIWKLAEDDEEPPADSVCLAATSDGFFVTRFKIDEAHPKLYYADAKPFTDVIGAKGEPRLSHSGSALLFQNRVIGTCVGIPSDRSQSGFYSTGKESLQWLRKQTGDSK